MDPKQRGKALDLLKKHYETNLKPLIEVKKQREARRMMKVDKQATDETRNVPRLD